jgi:hypothetical protein
LGHEAERLVEDDLGREPCHWSVTNILIANDEYALITGPEQEQGLFEAWIEPGQPREIGVVLAVPVHDDPVDIRSCKEPASAVLVLRSRNCWLLFGHAKLRE